jgi:transposase-like protein
MKIFKGENFIKFSERFSSDDICKQYLADIKWNNGFVCRKCGHTKFSKRADLIRTCTYCKQNESPTAHTAFHKVKFGVKKAFFITFEVVNSTKSLSAKQMGVRYGISRKTAWLFMHKIRKAMKSSGQHPMDGNVQVDEFTVGGKEVGKQGRSYNTKKKKIVASVELTDQGNIKRVYALKIDDYSSKSLSKLFDKHISVDANIDTDKWKGYRPLMKEYNITQNNSDNGRSMPQMHIIIHQIKSWLRTIHSWVHPEHIDSYLDEFSFRINRSIFKETIFHKIMERVVQSEHLSYNQIIIANK